MIKNDSTFFTCIGRNGDMQPVILLVSHASPDSLACRIRALEEMSRQYGDNDPTVEEYKQLKDLCELIESTVNQDFAHRYNVILGVLTIGGVVLFMTLALVKGGFPDSPVYPILTITFILLLFFGLCYLCFLKIKEFIQYTKIKNLTIDEIEKYLEDVRVCS